MKIGSILNAMLVLAFACLFLAIPSSASAAWTSPSVISGIGSSTSQTAIAGASDGTSWVVWKRDVAGFDVIQGTKVSVDGTQGPIVTISAPNMDSTDPVVASRADGSAMVAWLNLSATDDTVHSRSIAADGTLGAIETRSAVGPVGQPAADISIALGDDGTAAFAWRKFDGTNWVAQAVKVAEDGTSGTIHDLSDPSVSVGEPDIGSVPANDAGGQNSYQVMWPQGSGNNSNVGARQVLADDTVGDLVPIFSSGDTCVDPFDVNVTYASNGSLNAFWVCYRDTVDFSTNTHFFNWSVQWLVAAKGVPVTTGAFIENASPTVLGVPYPISGLAASQTYGGLPTLAWVHDLDGGGQRVETWRLLRNGLGQVWANTETVGQSVDQPAISSNASNMAIAGGVINGLAPGQSEASWTRFSNSTFEPQVPSGSFVYTDNPGFAMADAGQTLAAFTAIDGSNVGTTQVMAYTDPGIAVNPPSSIFGTVDIGETNTRTVTIRSSGQTPNEVTGIALSGPDAASYQLISSGDCVREIAAGGNCQFQVSFTPTSTATQNATVTVNSEAGNRVVNLSGNGSDRTRNQITASPKRKAVTGGRVVNFQVRARNLGGVPSTSTRVCARLNQRVFKLAGNRCRNLGSLAAGNTRNLSFRIRVTYRARQGALIPVTFRMTSGNAIARQVVVNLRRRGS